MKAAPMTQKPSFPLMKQGDIQNIYHLQMPRWLFTDPRYMGLALESKVAYTFLFNRFQLSRLNGWVNEDGEVFIIYTRHSLADEMQVSYRKTIESMKELSAAGLVWEKRCGRGNANQIYLALVENEEVKGGSAPFVGPEHEAAGGIPEKQPPENAETRSAESPSLDNIPCPEHTPAPALEVPEQHFKKCESGISGSAGTVHPEVPKPHPSQKEKSHTDSRHTETSPSVCRAAGRTGVTLPGGNIVLGMREQEQLARILDNCELWVFNPETAKVFANAIERLFYSDSFRIGKAVLPRANVRSRLWDLDAVILQSVEGKLRSNQRDVRNSTAYTMAVIFNTICEAHSDVLVDPYLNGTSEAPEPRRRKTTS